MQCECARSGRSLWQFAVMLPGFCLRSDWECEGAEEWKDFEEGEHGSVTSDLLDTYSDVYSDSQSPEAKAEAAFEEEAEAEARLSWPLHVPAPPLKYAHGSWEPEGVDVFGGSQGDSLMAIKATRRRSPAGELRGGVAEVQRRAQALLHTFVSAGCSTGKAAVGRAAWETGTPMAVSHSHRGDSSRSTT